VASRNTDGHGHVNVALFGGRRQCEVGAKSILNACDALVELDVRQHGVATLLAMTYNHLDAILPVSIQQGLCKTSGAIALFRSTLFVETDRDDNSPVGGEVAGKQAIDGGQHRNQVRLVVLGASTPDVFTIVVT
jgi:hypothetical protein